jgi:tetratricopeptide (TPR) repeat protein
MGNNPEAEGAITIIPGVSGFVGDQQKDVRRLAEAAAGQPLSRAQVSSYWYGRGLGFILAHPVRYLILELKKLYLLLVASDLPDIYDLRFERRNFLPALWWLPLPIALVTSVFILGLGAGLNDWRRWYPVLAIGAVQVATILLFFMATRFRLPLLPVMLLVGVAGVERLWERRLERRARWALGGAALAASALWMLAASVPRDQAFFHNQLGGIYAQLEQWAQARAQFDRAARLDPTLADAQANLGQIALNQRRLDAAEQFYRKAVATDRQSPAGWRGLAQVHLERGDAEGALEILKQPAVASSADYPILLAQVYQRQNKLDQAAQVLQQAIQPGRGTVLLYQELAAVEMGRGRKSEAQAALSKAEQLGGPLDARYQLRRGQLLLEQGDPRGAEQAFAAADRLRSGDPVTLGYLGLAAFRQGAIERAIGFYRRSLERNPGAPAVRANLGNALLAAGQPAPAAQQLEAALRGGAQAAEVRYNLGNAYVALGNAAAATQNFRRALELRPDYLEAYGNLGALYSRTGQNQLALEVLREGLRRFPASAPLHLNLAVALLQAGDRAGARQHLEAARRAGLAIPPELEMRLQGGRG